jgi:hypothetical protein
LAEPHLSFLPLNFSSHHYTSPHFTAQQILVDFRYTSIPCTSPVYLFIAFLTLFLKMLGLQGKIPNAFAGSLFQFLI